jgi:hypothetical protein
VAPVVLGFVGVTRLEVLKRTPVTVELNVPLSVTVEPTMPLVGEKVGTPGQVALGPVEYANDDEFPSVLCATTGFDVLGAALFGIVTSIWVSESMVSPVPLLPPKVTLSTGPPFATVWKFDPTSVTSHVGEAVVGVTDVIVGTAA